MEADTVYLALRYPMGRENFELKVFNTLLAHAPYIKNIGRTIFLNFKALL
jgi:hypothetical protein